MSDFETLVIQQLGSIEAKMAAHEAQDEARHVEIQEHLDKLEGMKGRAVFWGSAIGAGAATVLQLLT